MIKKICLLTCFILLIFAANGQNISFYGEDLNFQLTNETFEVDGLYYFRNNSGDEIKQMLFYPFPDVEKYGEISFISIHEDGDTASMLATKSAKGSLFKLNIPANGEVAYRINYGQKIKSNKAKYIITTTQAWKEPFEFAHYSLTIHNNFNVDSISIVPDSSIVEQGMQKYFWQRRNFMPEKDFVFWFKTLF